MGITLSGSNVVLAANQGLRGVPQNAFQGTPANGPTITSSNASFNNQPTFDFASASLQRLLGFGYTTSGMYELYVVFKLAADPPPTASACGLILFGGPSSTSYNPFTNGIIFDGNFRTGNTETVNPATSMTTKSLYTVKSGTTNWRNYLNGTLLSTKALDFAFPTGAAVFILGGSSAGAYLNGNIAEVIGVNGVTAPADSTKLNTYINTRYAMAVV